MSRVSGISEFAMIVSVAVGLEAAVEGNYRELHACGTHVIWQN